MERVFGELSIASILLAASCIACEVDTAAGADLEGLEEAREAAAQHASFSSYWYRGKAELDRYELQQARYGKVHRGDAVLIFVTEDFHTTKQVKVEGKGDASDATNVMKLNAYRRFYTGVYPYTIMTSVFKPSATADESPLKLTFTASEWCGHVFTQLNRRGASYEVEERSYFEAEGDRDSTLKAALTEDELMLRIRRDPAQLPVGQREIIPSLHHARLDHVGVRVETAELSLSAPDGGRRIYRVTYESGRAVEITFETAFPYRILGWSEHVPGQPSTRAMLTRSILLPYWEHHDPADDRYRKALGLTW